MDKSQNALRAVRKWRRLRREELAVQTGLSYETIASIEIGRTNPRADTLQRLADALDVPVDVILGRASIGAKLASRGPAPSPAVTSRPSALKVPA